MVFTVGVTLSALAGCPCGTQTLPVELTPFSGVFGYRLDGPYGFEGRLTKDSLDDADWVLEGTFYFPDSCYTVLGPQIIVRESFPEQVDVTMRVMLPRPDLGCLTVITEVPVSYRIRASNQAQFQIAVKEYCWSPTPPGEDCDPPRNIAVLPRDSDDGYNVAGMNFEGVLLPSSNGVTTPWVLDGEFTFLSGGYQLRETEVQIAESFPEQVTIILGYVEPSEVVTQAITGVPERVEVGPVSRDATFRVQVEVCE
jgi:hypothetical protein